MIVELTKPLEEKILLRLDTCCLDLNLIDLFSGDDEEPWFCSERVLECSNHFFKEVVKASDALRKFHTSPGKVTIGRWHA